MLVATAVAACNMTANTPYAFTDAIECIQAPTLTLEVFEHTQTTLENLFNLYALNDWSNNSPLSTSNVNITQELKSLRDKFQNKSEDNSTAAYKYFAEITKLVNSLKDSSIAFLKPTFF